MTRTPEEQARAIVDGPLAMAGWVVQDMADFIRHAAEGVAVREFPLPSCPCDYLLFVGDLCRACTCRDRGGESAYGCPSSDTADQ